MRELSSTQQAQTIKEALFERCEAYVRELLARAERGIKEAQEEAGREQKSSAGDKFETHRAMMHLQMETFIKRREAAQELLVALRGLSRLPSAEVRPGALIETDQGWYYLSISAPAITLEGRRYVCLSPEAPLARALLGARRGDWVEWGAASEERELEVLRVL